MNKQVKEYVIYVEDAKTLYGYTDFPFPLDAYLREEIVRCRDCKHCMSYWQFDYCDYFSHVTNDPNGFCAWGERRDS